MRTYDAEWNEVDNPDPALGRLEPAKRLVAHHDAVPERERIEEIDYDNPIKVYPNGGKDLQTVVVQEYSPPVPAWDEYEDCMVYTPYTSDELAAMEAERLAQEQARKEAEERAAEEARKAAEREEFMAGRAARLGSVEETTSEIVLVLADVIGA